MRSICKPGKFDELKCILSSIPGHPVHFIILTETWIRSEADANSFQIQNYKHYYNYRTDRRGGGVTIFAHNSLMHYITECKYSDGNNYLWIKVDRLSLDVGVIYKPGDTDINDFLNSYERQLNQRNRAVVFGDFNLDLIQDKNKDVDDYTTILRENNYKILNKIEKQYCTRETETTNTILDHVCTNIDNNSFHMSIIESSMSDHKQLYLEIIREEPLTKERNSYITVDYKDLCKKMQQSMYQNKDHDYKILEEHIKHNIENSKVTKTKITNNLNKDWISKDIIAAIKTRNYYWKKLGKARENQNYKTNFITQRNKVTMMIRKAKKDYYFKMFDKCKKNPKRIWRLINDLHSNKLKTDDAPTKLVVNNITITSEHQIANAFNIFFATIGTQLASKIHVTHHPNTQNTNLLSKIHDNNLSQLTPCTTTEVSKIIDSLDPNVSSGIDDISTKCIKCMKDIILEDLTACINRCLAEGKFPDVLKIAKVTPIFKSGCRNDPSNYRPISVLPVISKIIEKILHDRLNSYLTAINFLSNKQYGFRSKSSTLSATIDLLTTIKTSNDKRMISLGILIDLKKAFDTVSHKLLLNKLENMGLSGSALGIYQSYLSNRKQVVRVGRTISDTHDVICGIPQGSILGPLLFLVYVNDIHQAGLQGHITLYADDTSLFYFGNKMNELAEKAQRDLNILHGWFQTNLLTINITKTKYIIFKNKNKQIDSYEPLNINTIKIDDTEQEKYLGIIFDNKLTWQPHINFVKSKISRLTGALRRISYFLPNTTRFLIYNSLVKSHLDYLIELWGNAADVHINKLQRTQNKVLKVLFQYEYKTPTIQLYRETKQLNIKQLYIYNTCVLIYKIIHKMIHSQLIFTKNRDHVKYNMLTRNANKLHTIHPRTNLGKTTILYEGVKLYNNLPNNIIDIEIIAIFKKELKKHIIENYS